MGLGVTCVFSGTVSISCIGSITGSSFSFATPVESMLSS